MPVMTTMPGETRRPGSNSCWYSAIFRPLSRRMIPNSITRSPKSAAMPVVSTSITQMGISDRGWSSENAMSSFRYDGAGDHGFEDKLAVDQALEAAAESAMAGIGLQSQQVQTGAGDDRQAGIV